MTDVNVSCKKAAAVVDEGKGRSKQRSRWHTSFNRELVSIADSGNFPLLVSSIEKYLPDMNLVNITTAIHRLAKLVTGDMQAQGILVRHPVMGALTTAAQVRFECIKKHRSAPSCQCLSNIMWSMAVLNVVEWELLEELVDLSVLHIESFKPLELSTLLWACAKFGPQPQKSGSRHWAEDVFDATVDHIEKTVTNFTFRNLVTAIGAFAAIGKSSHDMFQTAGGQMVKVIHTANNLELAKAAWAFGTANVHHDRLFSGIAKHAIQQLDSFQQQELSNLLWGFAANEVFHQELFCKASLRAQRMNFNAQQLANILWSLTRMRPQLSTTRVTVRFLLPKCCERLHTFKPQELASTAMAAAKAFGHVGEDLGMLDAPLPVEVLHFFTSSLPFIVPQLHEFSDQSLANVATAFTAARASGVMVLLASVGQVVLERIERLVPPLLLQLIRTFTTDLSSFDEAPTVQLEDMCKFVARALFRVVSQRLDRFRREEQRSLGRLCNRALHIQQDQDYISLADLRAHCLSFCTGEVLGGAWM